ncbi:SDR family NAD(P)-dependent oxidoreductase [Sinorhizobium medicae]|uniref:SDR family NAD(P)-dependent oxidoreductase n=1 Tax=Sinorhizobium medicae TaxID=110321 RepID=UPI000462A383|nr:SDR family NAD(P)-dependent oxidoreductase [Sinorhizobium medicae]MBO1940222.1 SDR family NAD(P)-dependent oxidoreductase [Sinorhizobium medicae]MDX0432467.1 SDR family NAD(P)-dependent oxidoreductase [Sinorhizobium medicae]MDX0445352.1 SDR family NAD(P)-dependent oxidoreductase [Sinorhizobium medicae]MDX0463296.1 SDR family NAD(P)-dependent oxidoreductase [Sinorhizobium medicae]MDX0487505.1 SDR family NAD(P)-dependent oxidoreductase [Sinorhizobium medicae]
MTAIFTARPENGLAWITGASSGIGRALALRLVEEGYSVVVTARSHDKLVDLQHEAAGTGRIIVLDGDVTDPQDMERLLTAIEYEHGQVALAILNAGVVLPVRGDDLRREAFDRSFAVNLNGVVNCLVPLIEHMKAKGHGQIAVMSSVAGYGGVPTSAAYGASKAALINMAESLKFDLDRIGIRLQVICPGFVDTPGLAKGGFPRPALVSTEEAAARICAGLKSSRFEITFPRRFTYLVKLLRILPYGIYFALLDRLVPRGATVASASKRKPTGSDGKPRQAV